MNDPGTRMLRVKSHGIGVEIPVPRSLWLQIPIRARITAQQDLHDRLNPIFHCFSATPPGLRNPSWRAPMMWEAALRWFVNTITRSWQTDWAKKRHMR